MGWAFLFDLDGVLVDTHDIVLSGWRAYAATQGRVMTDAALIEQTFGRRTLDILVDVFDVPRDDAAAMVAAGFDDKSGEVAAAPLREVPGATRFVRATLSASIPCALASSAGPGNIDLALDALGLVGAFASIVDGLTVKAGKPAPDPYLAAAADLGVDPRDCVVFEDTSPGIEAGLAAGAKVVGVASLGRHDLVSGADLVIDDFTTWTPDRIIREICPAKGGRPVK